jgi:CheY-like chemotaxis protein
VHAAEDARSAADADARRARAALASAEAAVQALQAEKDRARQEIERLEAAAAAMIQERERLEGALNAASDREGEGRARLGELEEAVEKLRAERETEAAALRARLETVAAERDQLSAALAAVQAERDYFAADEAAADAAHARLEEALVRAAAERGDMGAAGASAPPVGDPPPAEGPPAPLEVEIRVEPRKAEPAPASETAAANARRSVVLDDGGGWQAAVRNGEEVVVVSPKDAATRLADLAPARLLVNLVAPGAFDALSALRAAGSTVRFLGCLAMPGGDRALPLGWVEAVSRPLDPDTVVAVLKKIATRGARVLTAGTSAEALISLRQALTREGLSVSMAWDGKQATDLIGMARPDVAVVELGLPPRAGYGIVAQLAACDPVPHAVLVAGEDDPAAGFAAALGHPMHGPRMLPLGRLLARLAGNADART